MPTEPYIPQDRKLPVKLERDLILDSVVEIRFVPSVPSEEVQTKIFEAIYKDFPFSMEVTVPPVEMRAVEPFKYSVTTLLHNKEFSIGFGRSSIVFNCMNGYKGWKSFSEFIKKYVRHFYSVGLFSQIIRVGLRYVNFFPNRTDLSQHIMLEIKFNNFQKYTSLHTSLSLQLKKGDCQFTLTVHDTALVNGIPGSVLDIDVTKAGPGDASFEDVCSQIEQLHHEEKDLFINILHPDFLQTLGPSY